MTGTVLPLLHILSRHAQAQIYLDFIINDCDVDD
jgi:hypothetical protein